MKKSRKIPNNMEDAFNVGQKVVDEGNKLPLSPKHKKKGVGMYMDY